MKKTYHKLQELQKQMEDLNSHQETLKTKFLERVGHMLTKNKAWGMDAATLLGSMDNTVQTLNTNTEHHTIWKERGKKLLKNAKKSESSQKTSSNPSKP